MIESLRHSIEKGGPPARLFVVILVLWLLFPFVPGLGFAQDAVPTVVAGELVDDRPDAIYGEGIYDLEPAFYDETCTHATSTQTCADVGVAFLSAPLVLPVAWAVALAPDDVAVALLRVVTSLAFVLGMLVLWARLAARDRGMPQMLFLTALALTPLVLSSTVLGTSSSLLFLSACLGLAVTDRPRRAALVGLLWAINVALRGFPALLGAVLIWRRRWTVLGVAAGTCVLLVFLWLAIAPWELLADFLRSSEAVASDAPANIYNASLDAALYRLGGDLADRPSAPLVVAARVAALGGGVWVLFRLRTLNAQWAYASLLALLVVPLVWAHYLALTVPAVAYALSERDARTSEAPRRLGGWLPVMALAASLAAATSDFGTSTLAIRSVVFLAPLIAVPLLARVHESPSASRTPGS